MLGHSLDGDTNISPKVVLFTDCCYQDPEMPASVVHLRHFALKMLAFKHAKLSPFVLMHQVCHAAP
jgi:hypothetical protein